MIKCESLRINMYRITRTGKSVNFPVTTSFELDAWEGLAEGAPNSFFEVQHYLGDSRWRREDGYHSIEDRFVISPFFAVFL